MNGEFLRKARRWLSKASAGPWHSFEAKRASDGRWQAFVQYHDAPYEFQDIYLTADENRADAVFAARAHECWPGILTVVERMEFEHADHKSETDGVPCRGCDVLDALDKKAGAL